MRKKVLSASFLMIMGFILFVVSAIALPSAAEDSRPIVIAGALGSAGLIVVGFLRSIFGHRTLHEEKDEQKEDK